MARLNVAWLKRLLPIIGLLVIWQAVAASHVTSAFLLPSVVTVAERVWSDIASGTLAGKVGLTLYRALAGFLIATVAGVTVGLSMSILPVVRWFFDPLISVGFPTPKIALLPIFMLWLGLGDETKIAMITFACFFAITTNAYAGALGVERAFIWSAQMLGASRRQILTDIILPAATPQILTGMQIALPVSLISTLVTEMIMGGGGLGGGLLEASRYADSPGVFAAIVEIAAAGAIVINVMFALRKRLLRWHEETQTRDQ
ncbi:ABC transporter permease [Ancylobacter sp. MQZ15Z-1]|uniref:ABC transporter permease n=1 Tax=Ancylobacter mangrovi TaxID=2972472 RepID=A0A9X2P9M9_9HYPH|nr:ABC transporter permease [Ancylobacter mangrovi]MCS0494757.1 ABC transporter permease [Ancylobacter mangrovi]